nr:tripeptidyl peptidase II N terminal [uncultured bacterium]
MANEATVFSLTTTEMATSVASTAGGDDVDVATTNAAAVPASIDIGLYILKSKYEGTDGRSRLLLQLDKLKAKIIKSPWPAI